MRPKTTVKIVLKVVINSSFGVIPAFVFFFFVCFLFVSLFVVVELFFYSSLGKCR